MSHFYTLVLLKKPGRSIKSAVEKLLEPYDENIRVSEYDRRCYCAGQKAVKDVHAIIDAEFGDINDLRNDFHNRHPEFASRDPFDDEVDEAWHKEVRDPIEKREQELLEAHPGKDAPESGCEECNGTGLYKSTYNPKSKWDWWTIEGRWSGTLPGGKKPVKELLKFNEKDFNEMCVPYALVTPDGFWHERGQMGWWGMSSGDKKREDWQSEVRLLLEANKDCTAVVVDCHI